MLKKTGLWRGLATIAIMLLGLAISLSVVLESNRSMVDSAMGTVSQKMVSSTEDGEKWTTFVPDDDYLVKDADGKITGANLDKIKELHAELGERIQEEGCVLLKNKTENGKGLPLKNTGAKVTLFGIAARHPLYVMGRGATMQANQNVWLPEAMTERGFVLNETMRNIYDSIAREPVQSPNKSNFDSKEVTVAEIEAQNASYQSSFAGQDAAVIVLYRPGAESADYYTKEAGGVSKEGARSPLGLNDDERGLINMVTSNFDNVIVLLNTGSAMEVGELEKNDKISSIMYVGLTGNYGGRGIADVLRGEVTPSGHLADTYASCDLSSPAMQNYGLIQFYNMKGNRNGVDSPITRSNGTDYLIEAENIYTGYKYYETRYNDCVYKRNNAGSEVGMFDSKGSSWSYVDEMVYPFGYGLSYTNFSETLGNFSFDQSGKNHTIFGTVSVTVKNTGNVKGKHVVQLYGQAPYTGKIEKAAIQLLGYAKTDVLAPGASETVTIKFDMQNIASYDSEYAHDGKKGSWMLEKGDYYFSTGNGAHDALNNILALQGKKVSDGMDYEGNSRLAYKWSYSYNGEDDYTTFAISKAGAVVSNKIELADWNNYKDVEKVTYLSRKDWKGTWPKTYTGLSASADMAYYLNGDLHTVATDDDVSDIIWGADNGMTLAEMIGAPYDDARWAKLLDQMSLQEAIDYAKLGGRTFNSIPSIGFIGGGNMTENGPFGLYSYIDGGGVAEDCPWHIPQQESGKRFYCTGYPNPVVCASTFNKSLVHEQGRQIGNDALFTTRYMLWGPGMNVHRIPYNGRNVEYYSEDSILLGSMGLEYAMGALEKGLIATPKHLAFNDQDQNRKGIAPFMTEQRAREFELRAFQYAFEAADYNEPGSVENGMMGFMTSFSKLGALEVNIFKGLLTGIVREEWGYNGYVVSDMGDDTDLYEEAWIAGMTGYDGSGPRTVNAETYLKDRELQLAVKEAAHRDMWVFVNSHYMNAFTATSHIEEVETSWRIGYKAGIISTAVLSGAFLALYILSLVLKKKEV